MTILAEPTTSHLLDGLVPGQRADLPAHRSIHGTISIPARHDDRWSDQLLAAITESGLTGRGGAAFPTGAKLRWIRSQRRRPVVAVNAMEGEPASRKDEVLATHVPHLVLDGAAAVARCVNAVGVSVCVPRGAETAAASYAAAVRERRSAGVDPVPVELVRPPGRYLAGEESALADWLDRGEGLPQFRPDRPAVVRVGPRPCLVDNAETLAHVGLIARRGAIASRSAATDFGPGTTLVTVSGAVARGGVYEIAVGTPVRTFLAAAGLDDMPAGVLLGGYGGTWLASSDLDVPYESDALRSVGATMGAGVVVALPATSCGLAETARIASWMAGESAGQCGPCAFGLPAFADDLVLVATGRARRRDVERLRTRLAEVDGRGACRHPDGVVRLVRSALHVFCSDLERHVTSGSCRGAQRPTVLPFPPRSLD